MDINYIVIIGAILAAIGLAWFANEFDGWNKTQSCSLSGGRNCGGPTFHLNQ